MISFLSEVITYSKDYLVADKNEEEVSIFLLKPCMALEKWCWPNVPPGPSSTNKFRISMFHLAFFNPIIDKHQHMHFFTFKTVLV